MNENTTVAGSGKVSVATRSNGADASIPASTSSRIARTRGSISATRRALNARAVGRRRRVCSGGSRLTIDGCGVWPPSSRIRRAWSSSATSGSCAAAAEKVAGSAKTASMSV